MTKLNGRFLRKSIFIDIDGTILLHHGEITNIAKNEAELLPGVLDKLNNWIYNGHQIILTTARPASMEAFTRKQLFELGIVYDMLLMGIGNGCRVIINDLKDNDRTVTALGISVNRNEGLININLDKMISDTNNKLELNHKG